ncbi:BMP family ABC transporter substrate-binding protein [Brevibacillus ruminantium]|uniref:BMP family ABC transporter substrate-binding protein n=1 Tax=Brevibacillus ruminantium TaxID=2950604 RepID=A0ABY4WPX6_9BACL|nr:BMP family ABC transporter substrate-binding protein [Brevibacillus ruminantium]USG66686.1 BMP family ABC transporter substrate-binding protein [Brevibacillus ruminantium]
MPKLQPFPVLFACLVVALLVLNTSQFLTSMQHLQQMEETDMPVRQLRIVLMLEGPTYDQGWNSSALESLLDLQKKYGFSLEVASNINPNQITSVAKDFASSGYDLIFGHGVIFSHPFSEIAPYYPETRFVSFNGEAPHINQTTIRYDMYPAGYLVGRLAAHMSRSRKVGYIIADKPTEYDQLNGFTKGVKDTSPKIEVLVGKVQDFNDIKGATEAAKEIISKGVDVLYTTGDSLNLPVITEAQRADVYAIGYIADQRYIAPNHVLASMIQDVQQCYRMILSEFIAGSLPSGTVTYGLKEGVNRLSSYGPMVPQEVREALARDLNRLINHR